MRQIVVTQTGPGSSDAIPLDTYITPFQVGIGLSIDADTELTIEHTFDNVLDSSVTPTWFPTYSTVAELGYLLKEDGGAILTESSEFILTGDYNAFTTVMYPVSAIRLNNLGAGNVTMTVLQAGRP